MQLTAMRTAGHTVRELVVWQRAMDLAEAVYGVTAGFPRDERFGLVSQCRRAAVSIVANIAEEHGRRTPAYFIQSLRIAQGSARELETELELASRLKFLDRESWTILRERVDHVSRLISNLSRSLARRAAANADVAALRAPRPAPRLPTPS